jgi:hypothetical protein
MNPSAGTLQEYYNVLKTLTEQEQTALGEAHAQDPRHLAGRFERSVNFASGLTPTGEAFYETKRTPLIDPPPPARCLGTTLAFASYLGAQKTLSVAGVTELDFFYLDREIFPLRSKGSPRQPRRSLDLLLANASDRRPIVAELKIRGDRPTYYAFIQLLMLTSALYAPPQLQRLHKHKASANLIWDEDGPIGDMYLIAYEPPARGKFRERSFEATKEISKRLVGESEVGRVVRRIVYLEASATNGALAFEVKFAFGIGS